MLLITVVAALLVCAHGFVLPAAPRRDGRIVGGSPANITDAPYQVALLHDWCGLCSYIQACGGSILSRSVILSAAHCPDGTRASQWRIRAGSSFHNDGGQEINVISYTLHSSYVRYDYDIALMFLKVELTLGSAVAIAVLPYQGQTVADGANAFITGWGDLTEEGSSPAQLYKVNVPVVNHQTCVSTYLNYYNITERMICAGFMDIGGSDACTGDSGGPMVVDGVLHGITAFGRGCARPRAPGVSTRVAQFRDWIDTNM